MKISRIYLLDKIDRLELSIIISIFYKIVGKIFYIFCNLGNCEFGFYTTIFNNLINNRIVQYYECNYF